jgi:hypothetical protein
MVPGDFHGLVEELCNSSASLGRSDMNILDDLNRVFYPIPAADWNVAVGVFSMNAASRFGAAAS